MVQILKFRVRFFVFRGSWPRAGRAAGYSAAAGTSRLGARFRARLGPQSALRRIIYFLFTKRGSPRAETARAKWLGAHIDLLWVLHSTYEVIRILIYEYRSLERQYRRGSAEQLHTEKTCLAASRAMLNFVKVQLLVSTDCGSNLKLGGKKLKIKYIFGLARMSGGKSVIHSSKVKSRPDIGL